MKRALWRVGVVVWLAGCGSDAPTGPAPGALELRVEGPVAPGAVLVLVAGGPVDSVESVGYYTASAPFSGTAVRVLVAAPALNGTVARILVPDRRTAYTATLTQAADGQSYALLDPQAYRVTLVPK